MVESKKELHQGYSPENYTNVLRKTILQNMCANKSSRTKVFRKKVVLKNFPKFAGKHLCQSLFFYKVPSLSLQLYQKRDSGTAAIL